MTSAMPLLGQVRSWRLRTAEARLGEAHQALERAHAACLQAQAEVRECEAWLAGLQAAVFAPAGAGPREGAVVSCRALLGQRRECFVQQQQRLRQALADLQQGRQALADSQRARERLAEWQATERQAQQRAARVQENLQDEEWSARDVIAAAAAGVGTGL